MILNLENNELINRAYYVKASLKTANGSINYRLLAITQDLRLAKRVIKESQNYYKDFEIYAGDFLANSLIDIMTKGELIYRAPTQEELQALKEFNLRLEQYNNGLIIPKELAMDLINLVDKLPKFNINFLDSVTKQIK